MKNYPLSKTCRSLNFFETLRVYLNYIILVKLTEKLSFPINIAGLKFVKNILSDLKTDRQPLAIYQDRWGKYYIAKQVNNEVLSLENYWFRNEIEACRIISNAYEKNKKQLKTKFPRVNVPKFIGVIEDNKRIILFTEMVGGHSLKNMEPKIRMKALEEAMKFMRYLSGKISSSNKGKIAKRTRGYFIITMPLIFMLAIFRSPSRIVQIFKAGLRFIINTRFLVRSKEYSITHRDLNHKNILLDKDGRLYLIDFELAAFTNSMTEVSKIAIGCWECDGSAKNINKSKIMREIKANIERYRLYIAISTYDAINEVVTSPDIFLKKRYDYLTYVNSL